MQVKSTSSGYHSHLEVVLMRDTYWAYLGTRALARHLDTRTLARHLDTRALTRHLDTRALASHPPPQARPGGY